MPIDWTGWPLVAVDAGHGTLDEGRSLLLDALEEASTRAEGFAVVVVLPAGGDRTGAGRDARGRRGVVGRLRAVRPGLRAHCRGIAFVVDPDTAARAAKVVRAGSVIMSCPTTAVHGPAAGRAWALQQLLDAGLPVPDGGPEC